MSILDKYTDNPQKQSCSSRNVTEKERPIAYVGYLFVGPVVDLKLKK